MIVLLYLVVPLAGLLGAGLLGLVLTGYLRCTRCLAAWPMHRCPPLPKDTP